MTQPAHSTPGPVDTVEPCTGDKWVSSPGDRRQYQPIYSIRDTIGQDLGAVGGEIFPSDCCLPAAVLLLETVTELCP